MSNAMTGEKSSTQVQTTLRDFQGHTGQISSLIFSADGHQAVSGSYDDTIRLWDVATGRQLHCLKGHNSWIKSVALSQDGKKLVSGSIDGTARVWDTQSGRELLCFSNHNNCVQTVSLTGDGKRAISGSEDGAVRVWDAVNGRELFLLGEHMTGAICSAISPNGKLGAVGIGKAVHVWNIENGQKSQNFDNKWRLKLVAFSPDSRYLLAAGDEGDVRLFDLDGGKEVRRFSAYNRWIHSLAFSADGQYIFASYDDGLTGNIKLIIRRWNAEDEQDYKDFSFSGHRMSIQCVAYSTDGRYIISGGGDKVLRLYEVK